MNIIVVDDEYYARKGMMAKLRKWNPEVGIEEAENGREALQKLETIPMDLVITDMKMPEMDGLQLVENLRSRHHVAEIIILSAHAEFSYAQQAMQYGVKYYLLKPIQNRELIPILDQLAERHAQNRHAQRREWFTRAVQGQASGDLLDKLRTLPSLQSSYALCLIQLTEPDLHAEHEMRQQLEGTEALVVRSWTHHAGLLVAVQADEVVEMRNQLQLAMRNSKLAWSAGMSGEHHALSELPIAYEEAVFALHHRLLTGWNLLYRYGQLSSEEQENPSSLHAITKNMYFYMKTGQLDACRRILHTVMNGMIVQKKSLLQLYRFSADVLRACRLVAQHSNEQMETEVTMMVDQLDWSQFRHMDEVMSYLDQIMSRLVQQRKQKSLPKDEMIADIQQYIDEHYMYDFSLDEIARHHYYVSPSYLSRMFKQVTGQRLSEYLVHVRMEKAIEMLETNQKVNVKDIALHVGYNDPSYFVQAFKKSTGQTPGSYRKSQDHA
ncbi:response regulator transcription factor [Marinicrinis sediminis]|uniref:Response regulator n=1 Tax=Marinicrinis sediminis TaxID=1652465 RepID=A0ABW5RCY9_9BACL